MAGKTALTNEPYEKYMGHDNNRDSYMMNGIDSRVRQRVWREWEPDIIYVHHQSSPQPTRIWIPPFADPVGFRAPPIPAREINTIGMLIAQLFALALSNPLSVGFSPQGKIVKRGHYAGQLEGLAVRLTQVAFQAFESRLEDRGPGARR